LTVHRSITVHTTVPLAVTGCFSAPFEHLHRSITVHTNIIVPHHSSTISSGELRYPFSAQQVDRTTRSIVRARASPLGFILISVALTWSVTSQSEMFQKPTCWHESSRKKNECSAGGCTVSPHLAVGTASSILNLVIMRG
jgi:hypothetical protein